MPFPCIILRITDYWAEASTHATPRYFPLCFPGFLSRAAGDTFNRNFFG